MATKLWTLHFMRICLANLLLFISLYMLYPVLPMVMTDRLGVPLHQTGAVFLLFTLAMFAVGPFHSYLVDAYKRKYVCLFSFGGMIAATAGYAFVHTFTELLALCVVQGAMFGLASTAGITLAIDITNSTFRSPGNVVFSWAARLGMIAGIALGVYAYGTYGFRILLYASIAFGVAGVYFVSRVYVPFRAPIGTRICSFDRFLLPRGWVPALNLAILAFVPGTLLPVHFLASVNVLAGGVEIPFFAIAGIGFLLSLPVVKMLFRNEKKLFLQVVSGLVVTIGAMSQLLVSEPALFPAAVLLGLGLGIVTPQFLLMFVKLSQHCQRGTANTTHLLAWEVGISSGIATACYLNATSTQESVYQVGMLASVGALILFALVTYPYYKRKKIR